LQVFAFPTQHRVPSQGYAVIHSKRGALFPQYANCELQEIVELRKQKVRVHGQELTVELVYSGDTTMQGLLDVPQQFNDYLRDTDRQFSVDSTAGSHSLLQSLNLDFVFTAEILIMEMTYLDGEVAKAVDRGHLHLQQLLEHGGMFGNR
jgi:hypothetical protein